MQLLQFVRFCHNTGHCVVGAVLILVAALQCAEAQNDQLILDATRLSRLAAVIIAVVFIPTLASRVIRQFRQPAIERGNIDAVFDEPEFALRNN
ncbi:MAG: hypothetical protein KBD64_06785 [Gammaproteobacteria bacterium]|nr:hypothetical protein [Gammaproteobacteria bacterium]